MKDIGPRRATVVSTIAAILAIVFVYALFGTVDLVFMKGENEVCYMEDVRIFSDLELQPEDIKGGQMMDFTYGENRKDYNADFEFRVEIAKTLIVNLFTFKWGEADDDIILHAK